VIYCINNNNVWGEIMTVYLKDLYFGCADGDTESYKKDFLDLFYTGNNKYNEIANDPMKFIVYGQKGTGKTIMGRYIEKTYNKNHYCCIKIFSKSQLLI
jgi:polynucleotide 5'-kinase involved in rRNA processing